MCCQDHQPIEWPFLTAADMPISLAPPPRPDETAIARSEERGPELSQVTIVEPSPELRAHLARRDQMLDLLAAQDSAPAGDAA